MRFPEREVPLTNCTGRAKIFANSTCVSPDDRVRAECIRLELILQELPLACQRQASTGNANSFLDDVKSLREGWLRSGDQRDWDGQSG